MQIPELKIIDKQFNLLAIIDTYTSFQGERSLWEIGKMEMHVGLKDQGAGTLEVGRLLMIDEQRVWEITGIHKTEDDALSLMVSGRELKGIFAQRVVVPDAKSDQHYFGWDRTPEEGDELELPNRNYILNSGHANALGIRNNNNTVSSFDSGVENDVNWITGAHNSSGLFFISTYVLNTFDEFIGIKYSNDLPSSGAITMSVEIKCEHPIVIGLNTGSRFMFYVPPDTWTRIYRTRPDIAQMNRPHGFFVLETPDVPIGTKIYWRRYKLEAGNQMSAWMPAPEDPEYVPMPPDATAEAIARHYVRKHATNPSDTRRRFLGLEMAPYQGRGMRTVWSERFKPLDQTLRDIGEHTGMGYKVTVDLENKRFVFDVIDERDQTEGSEAPVTMSVDFENIENIEYAKDTTNQVTHAYAGGAGEDENRLIQTVSRSPEEEALTGYARREAWEDCGSVDNVDDLRYEALYKLSKREAPETLTASALPNASFKYLEDWDIGSVVTVKSAALGIEQPKKITSVKEIYERGRIRILPTFGKRNKNILDEIRKTEVVR